MMEKCAEVLKKYPNTQAAQGVNAFIDGNLKKIPNVTAVAIANEYDENEIAADAKYLNKLIVISGTIEDIGKDILDTPYITLSDGKKYSLSNIQCTFDNEREIEKIGALSKGQSVKLIGKCSGKAVIGAYVKNCFILS